MSTRFITNASNQQARPTTPASIGKPHHESPHQNRPAEPRTRIIAKNPSHHLHERARSPPTLRPTNTITKYHPQASMSPPAQAPTHLISLSLIFNKLSAAASTSILPDDSGLQKPCMKSVLKTLHLTDATIERVYYYHNYHSNGVPQSRTETLQP